MKRKNSLRLKLAIYAFINVYIGWNGWLWIETQFSHPPFWLYITIFIVVSFAYILAWVHPVFAPLKVVGAYWFAVLQYAIIILPVTSMMYFVLLLLNISSERAINVLGWFVICTYLVIGLFGTYYAYSPVVRTYSIRIPKRKKTGTKIDGDVDVSTDRAGNVENTGNTDSTDRESQQKDHLQTLRIAMASDMHFGALSGSTHARRLVKRVNERQPDIIFLVGDIIDDAPDSFIRKGMGDILADMKAPLGIYGVLGNHEYYGGQIPRFLREMERIQVKILLDEVVKINEDFYIIGRKDRTDHHRMTIEALKQDLDSELPLFLLDHQPYELSKAQKAGIDLYLAGHTHRGQMAPNQFITKKIYELDWGYKKKGSLHAIVSSGFGFWGPAIRIGSRSEIVVIDVHFD
ncbi:metallophosphoesterase [Caldalkalibacillus salinus]|uniref:metallophosphoesterase n=1 Tax=Caldalkalibacillus salinus TaxID=2803787 RepID=UPI0030162C20